jgi:molecular chaperone GrpE (heat shock protein)
MTPLGWSGRSKSFTPDQHVSNSFLPTNIGARGFFCATWLEFGLSREIMPDAQVRLEDKDFTNQMQSLVAEAQHQMVGKFERKDAPSLLQMLRPLVMGIEALSRATEENTAAVAKLQSGSSPNDFAKLEASIQETLTRKNGVSQQMFDALYDELTTYKDTSLFDVLQKPVIRDIIILFDDLSEIQRQIASFLGEHEKQSGETHATIFLDYIKNLAANLDHSMVFIMEVLARMEVFPSESPNPKLDKTTQRAVDVELTEIEHEDCLIIKRCKLGFTWRGRMLRAEEVVVKKWNRGLLVAMTRTEN